MASIKKTESKIIAWFEITARENLSIYKNGNLLQESENLIGEKQKHIWKLQGTVKSYDEGSEIVE